MPTIFYVILSLIIVFGLSGIVYINYYNKMQNQIIRINEAEKNIDEDLRTRYDIIIRIEDIIKKETDVNTSDFKEINSIKSDEMSNFEFDRVTTKFLNLINQIKKDYTKLEDNQLFKEAMLELKDTNERIDASKVFYNKHTTELNKIIKKFPSLVVARIHRIEEHLFFDNKDMTDDNTDDFKL